MGARVVGVALLLPELLHADAAHTAMSPPTDSRRVDVGRHHLRKTSIVPGPPLVQTCRGNVSAAADRQRK